MTGMKKKRNVCIWCEDNFATINARQEETTENEKNGNRKGSGESFCSVRNEGK